MNAYCNSVIAGPSAIVSRYVKSRQNQNLVMMNWQWWAWDRLQRLVPCIGLLYCRTLWLFVASAGSVYPNYRYLCSTFTRNPACLYSKPTRTKENLHIESTVIKFYRTSRYVLRVGQLLLSSEWKLISVTSLNKLTIKVFC